MRATWKYCVIARVSLKKDVTVFAGSSFLGPGRSIHSAQYKVCCLGRQFINSCWEKSQEDRHYKTLIPWEGNPEELSVNFVKVFHVIKFQVLNLSPIILIVSLKRKPLPTTDLFFSLCTFAECWDDV